MTPALATAKRAPSEELILSGLDNFRSEFLLPPAVRMLRVIELAELQEKMLRRSAALSCEQRFELGLLVGRTQLKMSVDNLLRNTRLSELTACAPALLSFGSIKALADKGSGKLSPKELLQAAELYAAARAAVRQAFETLPEEEQIAGRALAVRLKSSEDERAARDSERERELEGSEEARRAQEQQLRQVVVDSEVRRRRLGQRTSASELQPKDVQRVLYGEDRSPFEQLLGQMQRRR